MLRFVVHIMPLIPKQRDGRKRTRVTLWPNKRSSFHALGRIEAKVRIADSIRTMFAEAAFEIQNFEEILDVPNLRKASLSIFTNPGKNFKFSASR